MSNEVFQQNMNDEKNPDPVAPISSNCSEQWSVFAMMKRWRFAALGHIAEFKIDKAPVQLVVKSLDPV